MGMKVPTGEPTKADPQDSFFGDGRGSEKSEGHEITAPLNSELFELTEVGAIRWLPMDGWSLDEAALLLSGANPRRLEEFAKDPNVAKPDFWSCGYDGIRALLSRAGDMGLLTFPATPLAICSWAAEKFSIPQPLQSALQPVAPATQAAPEKTLLAASPEWPQMAVARAIEIIRRDRKKDLYPSQELIADEIAKEFRSDGVVGNGGKPLTGAYIKRHALKGISSAQHKQQSTTIRRGK